MTDLRRKVRAAIRPVDSPPDDSADQPFRDFSHADIISFCLLALLIISIVAVLYVGRAFFLPTATALIVGTMLSPAAKLFERYGIPRSVSAVLIVAATFERFVITVWPHR